MWPSFSLCACRILKIRSCLRKPLAPGRSRVRAILVSSVMFFSLSSAIVNLSPTGFLGEARNAVQRGKGFAARARGELQCLLCCFSFHFSKLIWNRHYLFCTVSPGELAQHVIHGVLNARR